MAKASVPASHDAPLLSHLQELRTRILLCLLALLVASGVSFAFVQDLFALLLIPLERASAGLGQVESSGALSLIYTAPHEYFFTQLKLALFAGVCLAFPYIAFQLYRFVAPGLYKREKRVFLPFLVAAPILFAAGAALVYAVVMPLALQFFLSLEHNTQGGTAIQMMARVSEYLRFTMLLMLAFGLCFQLPVVTVLLARLGLVSPQQLARGRKYVIIGVFFVAAFLTPPDVISQFGLAIPTLMLYEIAIWCSRLVYRARRA